MTRVRSKTLAFVLEASALLLVGTAAAVLWGRSTERRENEPKQPTSRRSVQMMVKDHTEATTELSVVAAEMKIVPPAEIDKKHAELVERLSKLNGAEFDRAGNPPAGDPKAADLARGGPTEEKLTAWATKALPIVEKHLERARALQQGK